MGYRYSVTKKGVFKEVSKDDNVVKTKKKKKGKFKPLKTTKRKAYSGSISTADFSKELFGR